MRNLRWMRGCGEKKRGGLHRPPVPHVTYRLGRDAVPRSQRLAQLPRPPAAEVVGRRPGPIDGAGGLPAAARERLWLHDSRIGTQRRHFGGMGGEGEGRTWDTMPVSPWPGHPGRTGRAGQHLSVEDCFPVHVCRPAPRLAAPACRIPPDCGRGPVATVGPRALARRRQGDEPRAVSRATAARVGPVGPSCRPGVDSQLRIRWA
jgi:hypothetical protein